MRLIHPEAPQQIPAKIEGGITGSVKMIRHQLLQNKVVGLGEAHWFNCVFQYWQDVVLNDAVLDACQDIVLEAGNRKFQDKLTAFISNDPNASIHDVQAMLLESIVFPVWFAPYYLDFFETVKRINKIRSHTARPLVKLHVMEPIFHWRDIHSSMDYLKINAARDEAFFRYVDQHFIQFNKPVIAIMGARHLLKAPRVHGINNFAQWCEQTHPSRLFSVWPHIFSHSTLDALAEAHETCLLNAKGEDLQDILFAEICPQAKNQDNQIRISEQVDGVLLINGAKREVRWDTRLLSCVDHYAILHRAQFLNAKQKEVIHRMLHLQESQAEI